MAEIRTENLTILFIDIAGFTAATSKQSRAQNARLLETFNNTLLPLIRRFGGWVVKSIGDALLITFRSPTDGMLCAMALQDAMHEYNLRVSQDERIHIRIAASLGEVRVTKRDIFGEPVNVSSRIEGITPADEIYLSEAVYLAMNKAEVPAQEVGFKELAGISGSIRVYSIPRFSTPRLVPQNIQKDQEGSELLYPYGGMHQRTAGSRAGLQERWMSYAKSGEMFRDKKAKIGIAAVSGLLLVLVLIWQISSGSNQSIPPIVTAVAPLTMASQNSSLVAATVSASLEQQNKPVLIPPAQQPEPEVQKQVVALAAVTSPAAELAVQVVSSPQSQAIVEVVKTPASIVAEAKPELPTTEVQQAEVVTPKTKDNVSRQQAVAPQAETPRRNAVESKKKTPAPTNWSVISAKMAYKNGQITKPRLREIINKLEEEYESKIRRLKEDYRSGKINRSTYDFRAQATKKSFRGD